MNAGDLQSPAARISPSVAPLRRRSFSSAARCSNLGMQRTQCQRVHLSMPTTQIMSAVIASVYHTNECQHPLETYVGLCCLDMLERLRPSWKRRHVMPQHTNRTSNCAFLAPAGAKLCCWLQAILGRSMISKLFLKSVSHAQVQFKGRFLIVNASRIPPRPLAGQRLAGAGQQLEAWTAPGESSWTRLGVSKASSGELLEAAWGLQNLSWRTLAGVLEAP